MQCTLQSSQLARRFERVLKPGEKSTNGMEGECEGVNFYPKIMVAKSAK